MDAPNTAASGGGVYLAGTASLTGGTIAYNKATASGGGLYAAASAGLSGANVTNNRAVNGAGAYVESSSVSDGLSNGTTLTLSSGNIRANTATASGGGVYVGVNGALEMKGGTIGGTISTYGNVAENGAGVYLASENDSYGSFTLSSGSLINNRAGD